MAKYRTKRYKSSSRTEKWGIYDEENECWIVYNKSSQAAALRAFHQLKHGPVE